MLLALLADIERVVVAGKRDEAYEQLVKLLDLHAGGIIAISHGPKAHPYDVALDRSKPFPARHAGRCAQCDRQIEVGETVTYSRVDRTIWCSPSCERAAEGRAG